jgi:hypothetical protein
MPLRTTTLVLNSRDRDQVSQPTNNYTITLNTPVFNVVKVDLRFFYMSNGLFNIDTGTNTFSVRGTSITIPPGFYTEVDICSALATLLSGLNMLTPNPVTIDPATNSLVLRFQTTAATVIVFPNAPTSVLFGFGGVLSNNLGSVNVATSPNEVQMSLDPYLYLQSSKLQNQLTTSSGFSAFAVVPAVSMPGNIAAGESSLGFSYDGTNSALDSSYFNNPITLDMIDVRICDSKGVLANTRQNNSTIILTLVQSV